MSAVSDANEQVLLWINDLAGKCSLLDSFMRIIVNDYFIPVSMTLVLLGLWFTGRDREERERNQKAVFTAAIAIALTNVVVKIINIFYDVNDAPRPFDETRLPELLPSVQSIFYCPTDPSFPSNMAALTFTVAAAVWIGNRRLGYLLFVAASLVGFARVFAGVHYPLDIVGGAGIGIACAVAGHKVVMPLMDPIFRALLRVGRKLCIA